MVIFSGGPRIPGLWHRHSHECGWGLIHGKAEHAAKAQAGVQNQVLPIMHRPSTVLPLMGKTVVQTPRHPEYKGQKAKVHLLNPSCSLFL
jgi:hypothetical protein